MQTWDLGKFPQFHFTLPDKNNENIEETDSNAETISGSIQKGRKDLGKTLVIRKRRCGNSSTPFLSHFFQNGFSVTLQCVANCF